MSSVNSQVLPRQSQEVLMGMKSPFPLSASVLCRGVSSTAPSWDGKEVKTPLGNSGTMADSRIHIGEFPAKDLFLPAGNPQGVPAQTGSADGWPGHPSWDQDPATELLQLEAAHSF